MAHRKIALVVGGVLIYSVGTYVAMRFMSKTNNSHQHSPEAGPTYDRVAKKFDAAVDSDEKTWGIMKLRQELISQARGAVLEVAAGTGRNLLFYQPKDVDRLILIDESTQMLEVAKGKKTLLPPEKVAIDVGDATGLKYSDSTFDTVIDTYGLCSVEKPDEVLKEMQRVCKPDGRVLLLEHGRSEWTIVNWFLDSRAESHKNHWGCQWNKDIRDIVARSGLEILEEKKGLFGTNYYYVTRPRQHSNQLE